VRILFGVFVALATAIAVAFLLIPLAALFLQTSPANILRELGSDVTRDALLVSLRTSFIAHVAVVVCCTPAAWLLARRRFRGRRALLALVELPLVLPPAVAGIALLAAFGRAHLLGQGFEAAGVDLAFTQTAVVLAVAFVETPFYFRGAIAAFEAVDSQLLDAARTLGAGPARVFARIGLPLAAAGLGSASALALARGLGEFGATIIFAGSLQGVTQTLPLAIYAQFELDFDSAVAMSILFMAVGAAILFTLKLLAGWTAFVSTSRFRDATSPSS
jgi:molybdate transport system permease protein